MNIPLVDSLSSFFFQDFLWLTHFFPPWYFLSSNCKKFSFILSAYKFQYFTWNLKVPTLQLEILESPTLISRTIWDMKIIIKTFHNNFTKFIPFGHRLQKCSQQCKVGRRNFQKILAWLQLWNLPGKSKNLAVISRNFPINVVNNFKKSFVKSKSTFFLSKEHKYCRLTNLVMILVGNTDIE